MNGLPPEIATLLQFAAQVNSTNKNHDLTGNSRASRIQGIDPKKMLEEAAAAAQQGALIQNNFGVTPPTPVSAPVLDAHGNVVVAANAIPQTPGYLGTPSPLTQEMIVKFLEVLDGISQKLSNIQELLAINQINK